MLCTDFTTKLLGIKDVIVKKVEENEKSIEIHIEMPLKEQICPCCGCKTTSVHDYRIQKIKDIPSFGNASLLVVRKRRYKCKHCGKQFLEQLPFAPRYYRMTGRM
ncbi:MAG: transposase family protein, partial [Oscillospiraceae bacterium]